MGKIRVNTDGIEYQIQQMENVSRALETITSEIQGINRGLSWNISSREQIRRKLNEYSGYTERLCSKTKSLSSGLSTVKHQYMVTEQKAMSNVPGGVTPIRKTPASGAKTKTIKTDMVLLPIDVKDNLVKYWKMLSVLPTIPLMPIWGPMIFYNVGKNISWKLLDGKLDWSGNASWDKEKGEIGAAVEGKASGSLVRGSISGKAGLASGSGGIQIGTGAVKGEAGATLFKDGKLSPEVKVKASAEVAAVHGEAKGQIGNDDYNVHAGADGSLFKAKAEAGAGAGKITYKDESGNTKTGYGVEASAGAEAYVAEGKVSGGFTLGGVKFNVSLSGKAGGAGVKAGGRVTTGGASGEIGAGLGLGASVKLDIDWSGLFKKRK